MTTTDAPLSFGQDLFYQLDRATPGLIAYNVARAFRLRGRLDVTALQRAFDALVGRHDVLRSVYVLDQDHPVQRALSAAAVPFERIDLGALAPAEREVALARALAARAMHHFDLATEIPLRASLFRLADDEHALFFLSHHIVSDGWSKSITFRDLGAFYAAFATGGSPALAPLPQQFADHARRERAEFDGDRGDDHLAYWREKLAGPLPVLDLPTDRPRPTEPTFDGDVREVTLPASLVDGMRRLGQGRGGSLYMVLLAAYQALLHRYGGQDDIVTGSPIAGRDNDDTHDLIGYFAGALVLRNSFAGDPSFGELLDRVVDTCLDAYEHQDVPFEKLVAELQKGQQLTHAPLFRCVLTMEDTIPASLGLAGLRVESIDVGATTTKFDLTLLFSENAEGLRLKLAFRTALFDGDRIERMLGHLQTLLEAAIAEPSTAVDALPLLTPAERHELLVTRNATAGDEGVATTFVALVEAHAARHPERVAVVGEDRSVTWGDLNAEANRVAHALAARGAAPGSTVGLCLDRSTAMIVAMLGVAKAGAAYVPLLPDLPATRLAVQLAESGASVVITEHRHRGLFPAGGDCLLLDDDRGDLTGRSTENPPLRATPESLAYILFTSGSTGVPKGVAVTHANLLHYTRAIAVRLDLDLEENATPWSFATVSTLGADLGHTAIFPALCSGGTLHVIPAAVSNDATRFARYVAESPLDLLKITPNHFRALGAAGSAAAVLPARWIVFGGEALSWDVADELVRARRARVLNHYGPTETTVGVCTYEVLPTSDRRASATVPIGMPLRNTKVYVLDARSQPVPIGVPGELYVGGTGVARGYHGRDELTRERFLADPFAGGAARMYRTGDRVRWLAAGVIEFLGRADNQVKVRGYRVELGEIEQALRMHAGVEQAAALLRESAVGDARLAAYVVAKQGYAVAHADRPTPESLTQWIANRLPDYMVPASIVLLDRLPLNANGKLDRAQLPSLDGQGDSAASYVAPQTPTEEVVAQIWCDVLKRDRIGTTESFLVLGGHSLLAIRVLGRISKQLGVRLPLRALFEAPTVAQLARVIDDLLEAKERDVLQALAEVEAMSDVDVRRGLGDSQGGAA